ncbi:MAG: LysM peptidoglycan-binding domain-containing protein [Flavobacteriales bacterium]|nr:LysM peptidoglycan-binding domain-containing protein [Flavobacteriales bacterium]
MNPTKSYVLHTVLLCSLFLCANCAGQSPPAVWNRLLVDLQHQAWVLELEAIEPGSVLSAIEPRVAESYDTPSEWAQDFITAMESMPDAARHTDRIMQGLEAQGMLRWRLLRTLSDRHRTAAELALVQEGLVPEWIHVAAALTGCNAAYYSNGNAGSAAGQAGLWALNIKDAERAGLVVRRGYDQRHTPQEAHPAAALKIAALTEQFPDDPVRQVVAFMQGVATARSFHYSTAAPSLLHTLHRVRVLAQLDRSLAWDRSDALWLIRQGRLDSCSCTNAWLLSAAVTHGLSRRWLQQENPWLTSDTIPAGTTVLLPPSSRAGLNLKQLCATSPPVTKVAAKAETVHLEHIVLVGEVLASIARKYGVRTSDLRLWNALEGDAIALGETLKLYGVEPLQTAVPVNDIDGLPFSFHTVKIGETLWSIAAAYPEISPADLIQLNALEEGQVIRPGEQLKIPRW